MRTNSQAFAKLAVHEIIVLDKDYCAMLRCLWLCCDHERESMDWVPHATYMLPEELQEILKVFAEPSEKGDSSKVAEDIPTAVCMAPTM